MNKATGATIGVIVVLLLVGGFIFYAVRNTASTPGNATSTVPNTNQTPTQTLVQTQQPGVPLVTTSASVVPSDTTGVVTGSVNPNGAFTSYWYEYGVSSDLGDKVSSPSQAIGSGYAAIPAPGYITGLTKDTTYYFRLVAENQYGRVAGTQYSFQTTHGNPPPVGSAPTTKTLPADGISRTTANLNGEVTPNKASTQYWFEYGQTPELGNTMALTSAGDGTAKVGASFSLSNLTPATTYYFRLNAQNQFGTVNGAILNFKTAGPPSASAPTVITQNVADVTTSTAMLTGKVNPNDSETTYWFEYGTDSLFGSILSHSTEQKSAGAGSDGILVEAKVSDLSSKTNYYFRLVAQNNSGIVRGESITFKTK